MNLPLILAAVLLLTAPALTGAGEDAASSWPPITPEEIALKDDPLNPGAPAILLYRNVFVDDSKREETHFFRIKILKDEGKKYANVQISHFEKLYSLGIIRALVVNPDGSQVPFGGQILDSVSVKAGKIKLQTKTFTLPGVLVGSVIEYAYRTKWRQQFPDVLKNPLGYIISQPITYTTARWVVHHDLSTRRARFVLRALNSPAQIRSVYVGLPAGVSPVHQPDRTVVLDIQNLPGFQTEDYIPPEDELKGKVELYYSVGLYANSDSYWDQVAKDNADYIDQFVDKPKAMEKAVRNLVNPADSTETKLRKIYARVQQIRALSYERDRSRKEEDTEDLDRNKSVEDILKHGYARANEINYLFMALARAAGIQADAVLVASRASGFFRKNFLDSSQLDAIVVRVRLTGHELFFDPATLYCPYGLLPWEESGTTGVAATRGGRYSNSYVSTPPPKSSEAMVERRAKLRLDNEGAAEGVVTATWNGQEALEWRLTYNDADDAGRRKALEDELKGRLPEGSTADLQASPEWKSADQPLRAEFRVKIPHWGTATGRRLLVPLSVFRVNEQHPFPSARRVHPIYYRYPYQTTDEVEIEAPAGYKVEGLPGMRDEVYPLARYTASWSSEGATVKHLRRVIMDGYSFNVESYPALRRFHDKVKAGDEEQVVLQAVPTASAQ